MALWDFKIQTDNPTEANKPDIVVLSKETRNCYIIDVANVHLMLGLKKRQRKVGQIPPLEMRTKMHLEL